jgi:hypothetical protein
MMKMKKLNILILGLFFGLLACEKSDIPTYEDLTTERYVYSQRIKDSTEVSFVFYPGQTEIKVPFAVQISGAGLVDEYIKLQVVPEGTTADASLYEVPEQCVARAGHRYDTCWITVKKGAVLDSEKVRLQVKLVDSKDIRAGRTDCLDFVIWFSNKMSKPTWWTSTVQSYYFGPYTEEKLAAMMEFFGKDLVGSNDSQFRQYAIEFKQYLKQQKEAGKPLKEKNGAEMTVPVLGNLV